LTIACNYSRRAFGRSIQALRCIRVQQVTACRLSKPCVPHRAWHSLISRFCAFAKSEASILPIRCTYGAKVVSLNAILLVIVIDLVRLRRGGRLL